MAVLRLRLRCWVGAHWRLLLVAGALIGLAGGLAIGVAAGARRTASAPDRYTSVAGGDPDLVITQFSGPSLRDATADVPGVAAVQAFTFVPCFPRSPVDGRPMLEPNAFAGDQDAVGARIVAGRFADPAHPEEFVVNRPLFDLMAARFGTRVGETYESACFSQQQVLNGNFDTSTASPEVAPFRMTLVGITEAPSELDDPSPQLIFPATLLRAHPDLGVAQTLIAVHLEPGVDSNEVLAAVRALPNGSSAYPVTTRVVSDSARRAVRFQATSLWLVAGLVALAAIVVIAQVIARGLRVNDDERRSVLAIGWRRRDLVAERAIEGALATLVAAPVAVAVAVAMSGRFPLGALRSIEPHPGLDVDWPSLAIGLGAIVIVAILAAAWVAAGRIRRRPTAAGGTALRVAARTDRMPLRVAAAFTVSATRGRRPWTSVLVGALGVAGFVGAAVVGMSLTRIVEEPGRWGVNYDELFGNPYTDADHDIAAPIVAIPDVSAVTGATLGSLTINGADTPTWPFATAKGDLVPTVLRGQVPTADDAIGLGAEVARRLHVDVGDVVDVAGSSAGTRRLRVVGIVVTPASAGDGAALPFATYQEMNPDATQNIVVVRYGDDAPADRADAIAATTFTPPGALAPPASIRALQRVAAAPTLLMIVLAVLLLVGGAYLLAAAARTRRRDLAILRALGSQAGQLRSVVHWYATLVTAGVLAIGVPLGIVIGRAIVGALTNALGIVPGAAVSPLVVGAVVVGCLVVVNAIALIPARRVARAPGIPLTADA